MGLDLTERIALLGTGACLTFMGLNIYDNHFNPKNVQRLERIESIINDVTKELKPVHMEEIQDFLKHDDAYFFFNELKRLKLHDHGKTEPLFTTKQILEYKAAEGTVRLAKEISKLTTKLYGKNVSTFSGQEIIDFQKAGGTLDYLKSLAEIEWSPGNPLFRGKGTVEAKKNNTDRKEINKFAKLRQDHPAYGKNKPLFLSGLSIVEFIENGGTMEYLDSMLDFSKKRRKIPITEKPCPFSGDEVTMLKKEGVTIDYLDSLFDITTYSFNDTSKKVPFISQADLIAPLKANNVPISRIKEVVDVECHNNHPAPFGNKLFRNAGSLVEYLVSGGDAEYAKKMVSIKRKDGNSIFVMGRDVHEFRKTKKPISYARKAAEIMNNLDPYCRPREIVEFAKADVNLDYIPKIFSLKDSKGNSLFLINEVIELFKNKVPEKKIIELGKIIKADSKRALVKKIIQHHKLGLGKDDLTFKDTEKPNAVVTYPTADHNGAFSSPASRNLFKKLKEHYDVFAVVAGKESEIYKALNNIPNIEFLSLGGHGTKKTLTLSKNKGHESEYIDMDDNEMRKHLKNLKSNAVIFLNSCSNGEGYSNLANKMIEWSGNKTVYACKDPFSTNEVAVHSFYPFRASIKDIITNKDKTFSYNSKKFPVKEF